MIIDSPISTLPFFRAWTVRLLVPACFLALAVSTSLVADDEIPAPTWRRGISQWSGSKYELPTDPPVLSKTPANPLPYTIPIDPTAKTVSNRDSLWPVADDDATPELNMPQGSSAASGISKFTSPSANASATPWIPQDEPDPEPETNQENAQSLPPPASSESGEGATESESSDPNYSSFLDMIATTHQSPETAPLESEVVRWYQYPARWMRGWDSHAELGLNGSDGNADALSLQTGFELKRRTESKTLAIDVDYRHASSRNVTIQENGRLNIDYDRLMGSAWSGFGKFGLEWDRFKAFDLRLNFNGGIGYHLIRRKDASLVSRFGAGRSRETGAPIDAWISEAIFGIDAERQLTSRQKLKARVDYFPSLETSSNYRLVGDVAWEMLLDGSDNLSLKLAATDRYDSTPQGAEPNDIYFSVLLLRKF